MNETKPAWLDRLIAERNELQERITKLGAFVSNGMPGTTATQAALLWDQLEAMHKYLDILNKRLADINAAK